MELILIKLIKRYWPALVLLLAIGAFSKFMYDKGYEARDVIAMKESLDQSEESARELEDAQREFEDAVDAYATMANEAIAAEVATLEAVEAQRKKAADFYGKWQEAKKNVPIEINCSSDDAPVLSVGFVGLYNLSVLQDTPEASSIGVPEIASASGYDFGAAKPNLAQATSVTPSDVLDVNAYNMKVAKQCIAERRVFKEYLAKINQVYSKPPK